MHFDGMTGNARALSLSFTHTLYFSPSPPPLSVSNVRLDTHPSLSPPISLSPLLSIPVLMLNAVVS